MCGKTAPDQERRHRHNRHKDYSMSFAFHTCSLRGYFITGIIARCSNAVLLNSFPLREYRLLPPGQVQHLNYETLIPPSRDRATNKRL